MTTGGMNYWDKKFYATIYGDNTILGQMIEGNQSTQANIVNRTFDIRSYTQIRINLGIDYPDLTFILYNINFS